MKRTTLTFVLGAVMALVMAIPVFSANAAEYKKMTIMAATANPEGSFHVTALNKFKEIIEKESNGAITVKLFVGGSMGDEQANVKQLRNEELHVAVLANGNLTPFAPKATTLILPYMFPKIENAYTLLGNEKFVNDFGDEIAKQGKVRPVAWLIGGYRVLTNSKKPVKSVADLQGLKIRVPPVKIQLDAFKSWGVEPHPLAWSETFNALQQGVVDGQENPHAVNRDQKFWEVQKYITDLHYMLWVGPILVSENWYKKLPADTKALVLKAAKDAAQYEWKWSAEQDQIALKECLAHGMILDQPADNEAEWKERARAIWPQFYDVVGGKKALDDILAISGQ
ncbi:TRAP transporter substrate-binding protein [Desulfovibrio litoralis]|uniref:Tripartite ATP-independent transporter solute receptor, DctP family n=1 Tax=Desulfovibrio litoralis DSM 11393 TaxID=1121455 RepID=A0A1M7T3M2_9BACT|nr:TRAP transporter substrate-binding protein [Desulfovibrio litoralis]SHN65365.1 tripartite ATP-independent transporter solute receptor, DctP family [Desulfovibrio litoralis DSM 11393]